MIEASASAGCLLYALIYTLSELFACVLTQMQLCAGNIAFDVASAAAVVVVGSVNALVVAKVVATQNVEHVLTNV